MKHTTKKILVIEDNASLSELLSKQLISEGFDILTAYDGSDGLDKMIKEKPDAVIIDILLPKINGLKVLEEYRKIESQSTTPIIVLTNINDIEHVENAVHNKATAYLVKSDQSLQSILDILNKKLGENKV